MSPVFFFFNDTATTEIYTLSLHDALPISALVRNITEQARKNADREAKKIIALAIQRIAAEQTAIRWMASAMIFFASRSRSEEHTSELQSRSDLVCRLLLEKRTTVAGRVPA